MPGLLDDLRVVEVALLAPNMLGMHLADLGAEVIKVEDTQRGDYTRVIGPSSKGGPTFLHLRWNRGKRSIALDLRTKEGARVFRELVHASEVVIEGMRAGALARRGLGYQELSREQPSLVFCSLSGFGQTGPYRDLATHGVSYDAYGGHAVPDTIDDFPTIPRRYGDIGTQAGGLYGALAVLAAVVRARATGVGAYLDVAQADAAVVWNASRLDPVLSGVTKGGSGGADLTESVRYQYYATSDDKTILFQASEQHFFESFCRAVDREDLLVHSGAEFGEHATGNRVLRRELADLFATRTQAEWVQLFLDADVPGAPVHTPRTLVDDPQFHARMNLIEHEHPEAGDIRLLATPVHEASLPVPVGPAPAHGQHTDEILREVLDYDDERIAELRERSVIR